MRYLILPISMLLCAAMPAHAQVSVGIQSHGVSIGFNVSTYPRMVAIPGYPVYYDPRMNSNYFFYDGLYWVYQDNNWYSSGWYDGPWDQVGPQYVPAFVLRVPVRYYRQRPAYFAGWSVDVAPRWGEYWGNDWQRQRSGWDNWDRHTVYHAAPLPAYQAQYSGRRYPRAVEQQYSIQSTRYHYQPREAVAQQYYQKHVVTSASRSVTPQQAPSRQQSHMPQERAAEQAQQSHSPRQQKQERAAQQAHGQREQKQEHATEQAQQSHAQRQPKQERAAEQAQQSRGQQQQKQERATAQAQQQSHAQQQQKQERASEQAQQSHARQQQKQQHASDQAPQQSQARQQQQQHAEQQQAHAAPPQQQSRGQQPQRQQHAQQQAPVPNGPSNQPQQHQQSVAKEKNSGQKAQEKDKGDRKDGGGGGGPDHN